MEIVNLTFAMESSSGLWNRIFEGFDQDMVLTSRFEGDSHKTINTLYKFGSLLRDKYKNCSVEPREYGIVIKRQIDEKDTEKVNEWIELMKSVREEVVKLNCQKPGHL